MDYLQFHPVIYSDGQKHNQSKILNSFDLQKQYPSSKTN